MKTASAWLTVVLVSTGFLGCTGGDEIASVNGRSIQKAEFEAFMKFKRHAVKDPQKYAGLLDQYLEREALADIIVKEKLLDPQAVQVELNEFRKDLLINRYFQTFLDQKTDQQSIGAYYQEHASEFEEKKIKVAHVLIRANKKMDATEKQAKLTKAREAYSKLRGGEDFAKVAELYSEDKTTAKKGGELGWLKENSVDPVFSQKVFGMRAGEISEPFETPFGYHVVKILEDPKAAKQPLQAVEGVIRYRLRTQAKETEMQRLLKKTEIEKMEIRDEQ